ncbi:MAG TPA: hypothetical protein VFP56_07735 [Candidatus Limnocylindrales bacterium]|nr:hypothetical protein [Candidatus Limnocylindrales bacterium]
MFALTVASLGACAAPGLPSIPIATTADGSATSGGPSAGASDWRDADLFAVVTADELDFLVGIDVERHAVKRLAILGANPLQAHMDGYMASPPPSSFVLWDASGSSAFLWTRSSAAGPVVVRELDAATGQVSDAASPGAGTLPFLVDGKLGWAADPAPADTRSTIHSTEAGFDIELPGVAHAIVPGPGPGLLSATVILPDNTDRVVVLDVAKHVVTELPTPPVSLGQRGSIGGGTIWADDDSLVASVFARREPTPDDPENGEPDKTLSLLTWSVDTDGSNPKGVAGLVPGPTLGTTEYYPTLVAGDDERVAVVTGVFDEPFVEAIELGSGGPAWKVDLVEADFATSMTISGTTLVILQSRNITFVDLPTGDPTTVELGGVTMTSWVGPYGR